MVYFEMVLLVVVAMVSLVILALVASSGPVSHLRADHPKGGRRVQPPARPWSHTSTGTPSRYAAPRRGRAAPCGHAGADWSPYMDRPEHRATSLELER